MLESLFNKVLLKTEYCEIFKNNLFDEDLLENTDQKKLRMWTLFTQWIASVSAGLVK